MRFVVLCGGSGDRMKGYSMPKPLNMIWAKPAIYYTLYNLPETVTSIDFIMSTHLDEYNFEPVVKNLFRKKKCSFYRLPYFTRGPVETTLLGVQEMIRTNSIVNLEEPIVFLDNDVYSEYSQDFFTREYTSHFLGYSLDTTGSEAYSFLKFDSDGETVIEIQEKKRISNNFCCGAYGFKCIQSFLDISKKFLASHHEQEYYMSYLFQMMLSEKQIIKGISFKNALHLGSLEEVKKSILMVPQQKLRICFDLDNTLVTNPYLVGDYSTVKPITNMINLASYLHNQGHTIIIYTARRMETHKYNVGAVIKDIARETIDTLEKLRIPYDELIFGKPIADIYIDDRAVNPYRDDFASMGLIDTDFFPKLPVNKLPNNKYNRVTIDKNDVIKQGHKNMLIGELEFYKNIPQDSNCINMFPKLLGYSINSFLEDKDNTTYPEYITMRLEHIKGIPIYYLFRSGLLTVDIVNNMFTYLDVLHNTVTGKQLPSTDHIINNYINKLEKRFEISDDFPFDKKEVYDIQQDCLNKLKAYCEDKSLITKNTRHIIHGDFWFSNIILEFKKNIKAIDMKGHLDGFITMGGDCYYDYGKLLQSFLGYDLVLYGDTINKSYIDSMLLLYKSECQKRYISYDTVKDITFALVMGTLHFIESQEKKTRVWKWIIDTFM